MRIDLHNACYLHHQTSWMQLVFKALIQYSDEAIKDKERDRTIH